LLSGTDRRSSFFTFFSFVFFLCYPWSVNQLLWLPMASCTRQTPPFSSILPPPPRFSRTWAPTPCSILVVLCPRAPCPFFSSPTSSRLGHFRSEPSSLLSLIRPSRLYFPAPPSIFCFFFLNRHTVPFGSPLTFLLFPHPSPNLMVVSFFH